MFRRLFLRAIVALCVALVAGPAWCEAIAKHVLIVSLDGGKPAVMQQSVMPATMQLKKEGAGTWVAQTVLPSITLVSHVSMLTGVQPAKHKIDWNSWQPDKAPLAVPTIFGLAKAQGLSTALFAGKDKFKHLNLPNTLDEFQIPADKAIPIAEVAGKYITEKKPALIFVHFPDSDTAGHKYGWGSKEQIAAFADEDTALKTLLDALKTAGIDQDTVVIISADHGGHGHTHGSGDPEDVQIPWLAWGKGVKRGFEITDAVSTCDTAATALWVLGVPVPADFDGKPVTSAFVAGK